MVNILPVDEVTPRLVEAEILTPYGEKILNSLTTPLEKAEYVLRKVARSLVVGINGGFFKLLHIMELCGGDADVVVTEIKEKLPSIALAGK